MTEKIDLQVGDKVRIGGGDWLADYKLAEGTIVTVDRVDNGQAFNEAAGALTNVNGAPYSMYPITKVDPAAPLPELLLQAQEQFADFTAGLAGMVKQLEDAGFPHEQATTIVTSIFIQSNHLNK